jgi:hypothetical protein
MLPGAVVLFLYTYTLAVPALVANTSSLPSPSISPIFTFIGKDPVVRLVTNWKLSAERLPVTVLFLKIETEELPTLQVAISSLLSPSKSPKAT